MELVPLVCGYMTPETQEALPHLVTSCQAALDTIATAASPKEMLMAVVEQLDTFQDTWQVIYLNCTDNTLNVYSNITSYQTSYSFNINCLLLLIEVGW